jgi:molybdenum cofactor cytidylyltransferase
MRFGPVSVGDAEGAILAHSLAIDTGRLRKGQVLGASEIAALRAAGIAQVTVARLGAADVPEDTAADRLARALVPDPAAAGLTLSAASTGRVNINAAALGVLSVDAAAVHALNRVDAAITLATLRPMQRVTPGLLVGTVKIIAYGVDSGRLDAACAVAAGALRLHPVARRSAGLILTAVPGQDAKLNAKGRKVVAGRLAGLGLRLSQVIEVPHDAPAIAAALTALAGDIALILTGSATSDLYDTAPEGLRGAGGQVARFGMPVDPGNLLFTGALPDGRPVIGLPGCARSPALNGADWVLERIACGLDVSDDDIAAMGVGGLLKEPPSRPHPRERRVPPGGTRTKP